MTFQSSTLFHEPNPGSWLVSEIVAAVVPITRFALHHGTEQVHALNWIPITNRNVYVYNPSVR